VPNKQTSTLSLSSFFYLFQDDKTPCIIENDGSMWVVIQVEHGIHLALLASKAWLPRHVTQDSLAETLRHIHHLMCLLFCSVQSLLDKAS